MPWRTLLEDHPSKGPWYKSIRWLHGRLSFSTFWGQANEYQEFLGTWWLKLKCLVEVAQQPWNSWTLSIKRGHKVFEPLVVAKTVLQNRVYLSFRLCFCLFGHFLGIVSLVFSKFWHGARNVYEVVWQYQIFQTIFFCP